MLICAFSACVILAGASGIAGLNPSNRTSYRVVDIGVFAVACVGAVGVARALGWLS